MKKVSVSMGNWEPSFMVIYFLYSCILTYHVVKLFVVLPNLRISVVVYVAT